MNHNVNTTTEECPVLKHKIGQRTYVVKVHFNESGATMNEKIKHLLK